MTEVMLMCATGIIFHIFWWLVCSSVTTGYIIVNHFHRLSVCVC